MNLLAPENITFEEAINLTQSFLNNIDNMSEEDQEKTISSLVKTENGARGFFVTYLTDERPMADNYSTGVINGLKSSPEIVGELLVKNVAMSTGMSITHKRNSNEEMAEKSQRVTNRCINLIRALNLKLISQKITQLITTINQGEGVYQSFLERWGYDEPQKEAIKQVFEVI